MRDFFEKLMTGYTEDEEKEFKNKMEKYRKEHPEIAEQSQKEFDRVLKLIKDGNKDEAYNRLFGEIYLGTDDPLLNLHYDALVEEYKKAFGKFE